MKLSALTIIIIGIAIAVISLSFAYFQHYKPNMDEAKLYRDYQVALQTEADKRPLADRRVKTATDLVTSIVLQWQQIAATRTPPNNVAQGGIDLGVNAYQLVPDARRYRNNIQLAVNHQVKLGGVKLPNGGPSIPDPGNSQQQILTSFFNFPPTAFPVVLFDLGQITVQGTYNQIVANYEAWGRMPRYMVLVDGLQITGTSPILTGTYNVQLLGFIRATDIAPPAPEGATLASNNGGRGGGGGGGGPSGPPLTAIPPAFRNRAGG